MRTVTFKSVLEAVARRAGVDPALWDDVTQANVAEFINSWAKKAWEWDFWPEWSPIEQRAYRDAYVSTTAYPAPTATAAVEVWSPAAQQYAQALQVSTGQTPFIDSNGSWLANAPYWALSNVTYSGSDWAPGTAYSAGGGVVAGTVVRNPLDNRWYQTITDHTSGSTFDPTKFGILTTFERYVSLDQANQTPIGEVSQVSKCNPRTSPRYPGVVSFLINNKGILPAPNVGPQVWISFRLRPPVFTTIVYDNTKTYASGDPVYQPGTTGECYVSLTAANTGNVPETNAAKWQKQDMPAVIEEYVKWAAYSDLLRSDGQSNKADGALETAQEKLTEETDVVFSSQAQFTRATVQI